VESIFSSLALKPRIINNISRMILFLFARRNNANN